LTNVTPLGSVPVSDSVGVGVPVVVTAKVPNAPTVNVAVLALVIAGAWFTFNVKLWLAGVPTPLLAVIVRGYVPPVAGVPLNVAVPFPLSTNVTPLGSAPVSVSDGVGDPVAVTVKKPSPDPISNVALLTLVIAGA